MASKRRAGTRVVDTELGQFGVVDCETEHLWCSRIRIIGGPENLPVSLHWNCGPEKPLGTVPDFQPRRTDTGSVGNVVDDVHTIRRILEVDFRINCRATVHRRLSYHWAGGGEN